MPSVHIKMIDGSNIVTDQITLAEMKNHVKDGQVDASKSIVDVPEVSGETISVNVHRICYVREITNT